MSGVYVCFFYISLIDADARWRHMQIYLLLHKTLNIRKLKI